MEYWYQKYKNNEINLERLHNELVKCCKGNIAKAFWWLYKRDNYSEKM